MGVAAKKLTWEDIKDWPEHHGRTEIVDGHLVMSPVASPDHQWACSNLGALVLPFVRERDLGYFFSSPIHVILDEHVHYEPDLSFVAKGRMADRRAPFRGAPDLVIEVLSPSNREHDTITKFRDYERYGVREYWLVDVDARWIEVWFLEAAKYRSLGRFAPGQRVVTRVLNGLDLDPAQVF